MKLIFTKVLSIHNSACVIQNWSRYKLGLHSQIAYISKIFPSRSKIIQLLFSRSSILVHCLEQKSYIAIRKKIILK